MVILKVTDKKNLMRLTVLDVIGYLFIPPSTDRQENSARVIPQL